MPFKSKAQQHYLYHLKGIGKLPKSIDLNEYSKATDFGQLPEKAPAPKFKKLKRILGK